MAEDGFSEQNKPTVAELFQKMPKRAAAASQDSVTPPQTTEGGRQPSENRSLKSASRRKWFGRAVAVGAGVFLGLGKPNAEGESVPAYVETEGLLIKEDYRSFYLQTIKNLINLDPESLKLLDSIFINDLKPESDHPDLVGDNGVKTPGKDKRINISCNPITRPDGVVLEMPSITAHIGPDNKVNHEYLFASFGEEGFLGQDVKANPRYERNLTDPFTLKDVAQKHLRYPPKFESWRPSSTAYNTNPNFREVMSNPEKLGETENLANKTVSYVFNTNNSIQINLSHHR